MMTAQEMKKLGMNDTAIAACIAAQEAARAAGKAEAATVQHPLKFKVSEKGAVSVYNIGGKFPVTLYASQMERLLEAADDIRAFIAANPQVLGKDGARVSGLARKVRTAN